MPFWRTTALEEMSKAEWESLCDGCGRCCLNKIEDEDTGEIHLTSVACRLLHIGTCRCRDYPGRFEKVPDCISAGSLLFHMPSMVSGLRKLPCSGNGGSRSLTTKLSSLRR